MTYDCLIIDDEKLLADSTAEYFNLFGVKTAVVYSAADCRKFFKENTAELLLLDINLGDGSGFELCKELRSTTEIPILFQPEQATTTRLLRLVSVVTIIFKSRILSAYYLQRLRLC